MKKLGIGLTISAAVLGGFVLAQSMTSSSAAIQTTENTKLITENEAREIALKKFNGTITEVDYDQDNQRPHYEFEIQSDNKAVEIDVNAKTGKATITDSEVIKNKTVTQTNETTSKKQNAATSQPSTVEKNQAIQSNTTTAKKDIISKGEAIKIASSVAKGTVTKAELDVEHDDNTKTYELEFKDGNVEYSVDVDAYTGKVIEVDQDIED